MLYGPSGVASGYSKVEVKSLNAALGITEGSAGVVGPMSPILMEIYKNQKQSEQMVARD